MIAMTKKAAETLAKLERDYVARPVPGTDGAYWLVWCSASDHDVDFDFATIVEAEQYD